MKTIKAIKLANYGAVLTGRDFGKEILSQILKEYDGPYALDFSDVLSMGSSFGEELIPKLAEKQDKKIKIIKASSPIKSCLKDIENEIKVTLTFV